MVAIKACAYRDLIGENSLKEKARREAEDWERWNNEETRRLNEEYLLQNPVTKGSHRYFEDLPTIRPRFLDRIEPAPNQSVLTEETLINLEKNEAYIYVVDADNNIQIAPRVSPDKLGTKHTQLTGGGPVKTAGEFILNNDGTITINNRTGRYSAQHDSALSKVVLQLEDWGATVEIGGRID